MAQDGFARNVTANIGVPASQTPTNSVIGDITNVASFGLDLYSRQQEQKKQEQAVVHEESLFTAAGELDNLKLELQGQNVGSVKANNIIEESLRKKGFSATSMSQIRAISAKRTGTTIKDKATQESTARFNKEKDLIEAKDAAAQDIGFLNFAAIGTGGDKLIMDHLSEQARLKADAAEDAITLRRLNLDAATETNLDKKASLISKNVMSEVNIGIRNDVRVGYSNIQKQRVSGEIKTDKDMAKAYADLIDNGLIQLDQEFSVAMQGQTDQRVKSRLETGYTAMREQYSTWAKMYEAAGSGVREQKIIEQFILNTATDAKSRIYAVDGMAEIVAMTQMKLIEHPLSDFGIANAVIGDQIKVIAEVLKTSMEKVDVVPEVEREAVWEEFYKDVETEDLRLLAKAVNKASKDLMSGVIELEGGNDFAMESTISYMNEVAVGDPKPNQFIKEVVDNFTDRVLHTNYDSMPEEHKKRIGDLAPSFTRKFFGTNNTGSFVPSVNQMLRDSGLGTVLKSSSNNPLWSLGINKDTGMLEVSLPSDKRILENLDASGSGRSATGGNIKEIRKRLRKFKQDLETNPTIRKVLQATAKSTGKDLDLVTGIVLSDLSISSNIPVAEAFTTRQAEDFILVNGKEVSVRSITKEEFDGKPEPSLNDISDLTREEVIELQRLQLEEFDKASGK